MLDDDMIFQFRVNEWFGIDMVLLWSISRAQDIDEIHQIQDPDDHNIKWSSWEIMDIYN
jgi:hypothetical protein